MSSARWAQLDQVNEPRLLLPKGIVASYFKSRTPYDPMRIFFRQLTVKFWKLLDERSYVSLFNFGIYLVVLKTPPRKHALEKNDASE